MSAVTPMAIRISYTAASKPWLKKAYTCAGPNLLDAQIQSTDALDPSLENMTMRIGEPAKTTFPTYQVGTDLLEIIGNPQNPVKQLTVDQARDLFTGRVQNWKDLQGQDTPVEVWSYASGEDIQKLLEQKILAGSPVTSLAHLAVSPDEMASAVAKDPNAVGLLTQAWKAEGISNLLTISTEPVLVSTSSQPQGAVLDLIHCLQK